MTAEEMTQKEIEQFLTCARVGRLSICIEDKPYIVPVAYAYSNGEISFHTCTKGLKMEILRKNPNVCFEVDESLSDTSMFKSVVIFGIAKIIETEKEMIPYLQKLIDKYRIPENFEAYMSKPGKNRNKELEAVRICIITPKQITGRKYTAKEQNT
jgi:nitroimidazol reductase NimA-like FMN-containing flavoprotein (pyridoxamine 5'-phosphate oxidase superfamily)